MLCVNFFVANPVVYLAANLVAEFVTKAHGQYHTQYCRLAFLDFLPFGDISIATHAKKLPLSRGN